MFVYHRKRGWRSSLLLRTASRQRVAHVSSNILVADLTIERCSTSHGTRVRVQQFSIQRTRARTLLHYGAQHVAISAIRTSLTNELALVTSGEVVQALSRPAHDVSSTIACNIYSCAAMAPLDPIPHYLMDQLCRTHLCSFGGCPWNAKVRLSCVDCSHHALSTLPWPQP
jgi:hypothetical protein